jgi:hypothetical protein
MPQRNRMDARPIAIPHFGVALVFVSPAPGTRARFYGVHSSSARFRLSYRKQEKCAFSSADIGRVPPFRSAFCSPAAIHRDGWSGHWHGMDQSLYGDLNAYTCFCLENSIGTPIRSLFEVRFP